MRFLVTLAVILGSSARAAVPADFARDIKPILEKYCYDCHDTATHKSGLDLERFSDFSLVQRERVIWGAVLEKVESHQMPPPKEQNQPTAEERRQLVDWINHLAGLPDLTLGARDPGKPFLRRLTRLEYSNTVRDLLDLSTDVFMFSERLPLIDKAYFQPATGRLGDTVEVRLREYGAKYPVLLPVSGLPADNRAEHGYRNRGDANNLSPLLLEKYVALAGEIVAHPELPQRSPVFAALLGVTPPPLASARPSPSVAAASPAAVEFAPRAPTLPAATGSALGLAPFRSQLAAALREGRAGVFDVPAAFANQTIAGKGGLIKTPFGRRVLEINPNADLWLAGFASARATSGSLLLTNKIKGAKSFELTLAIKGEDPDEGIETLAVCVLGRKGQSGRVTLTARFSDATETKISATLAEGPDATTFFSFAAVPGERITRLDVDGSGFSGDYVLLDDLAFITNGKPQALAAIAAAVVPAPAPAPAPKPIAAATPTSRSAAPGPLAPLPDRLSVFLERAFRRPAQAAEFARYLELLNSEKAAGRDDATALRVVVQAVLSSPRFLFLSEPADSSRPGVRPLDNFELASRLSYFLWASMPDAELLAAARAGNLHEPDVLAAQTRRMLRDPKARELSESFAVQWLRLDQLSTAKPDTDLFKVFYAGPQGKDTLHGAMLTEALLLFETVLVEDRSILDFIAADYTWLNPRLAKSYGLAPAAAAPVPAAAVVAGASNREVREAASKAANTWRRTALTDSARGGFIAMGGPLTVTSLPFRTSPVKRGAWLLETIFNRPPQEPKVAFAIENDTKEAAAGQSIRQKFEAHRNKAACYSCHVRLDPPGFALERFDPIGRWRETDGGQPVDARGEWNGTAFDGPAGYKAALLRDPGEFTRGFTEHLLSYALGRKLELFDLPAVQEIQRAAAADGNRLSRIVVEIALSYPFLHTRNRDLPVAGQ